MKQNKQALAAIIILAISAIAISAVALQNSAKTETTEKDVAVSASYVSVLNEKATQVNRCKIWDNLRAMSAREMNYQEGRMEVAGCFDAGYEPIISQICKNFGYVKLERQVGGIGGTGDPR